MADADKPIAKLEIDDRQHGPLVCEYGNCAAELDHVLLMEDGGVCCPECRSHVPAFAQFSKAVLSVQPVKLKGRGHVCGDGCRRHGCKFDHPEIAEENGGKFVVVDEEENVIKTFKSKSAAEKFADEHNEDRHPNTMEYFVEETD